MDLPLKAGQTSNGCTSYYLDSGYGPLFPFGYGLSYTTFEYSDLTIDKREYSASDTVKVKVTLKNSGEYAATEVAQLYVRDLVGSIARPVKELKGFQRVTLGVGESKVIEFSLQVADLAFWNINNEYVVEPGDFHLWVATDSASGEPVGFSVK